MIYKCKVEFTKKSKDVYLYVDYEDEDDDYSIEISYNPKLYTEEENLIIEYHLDKYYEEIKQDIILQIQNNRK